MICCVRRTAAACLTVVLVLTALVRVVECAGWRSSAVARMACCENADHPCADQVSADACCARSEQGKQPPVVTGIADLVGRPTMVVAVASLLVVVPSMAFSQSRYSATAGHRRPPGSPPVLPSVLRI